MGGLEGRGNLSSDRKRQKFLTNKSARENESF
nr:MAG TPA: hypothetical protein [Caudoviricetes sp.]